MFIRKISLGLFCLLLAFPLWAATSNPVQMLETTSNQMIAALKANKATIKSNPMYVEGLARRILLPHVDVTSMSRLALGRNGWQSASSSQRTAFMQEFVTLLLRTYGTALASYTNQSVQFMPLRENPSNKTQIQVYSKIIQPGGPSIPMSYRLVRRGNQWYVYDMSVDGVSIVRSFRSQFSSELSQGGMPALLNAMRTHNQRLNKTK